MAGALVGLLGPLWASALVLTATLMLGLRTRRLRTLGLVLLGLLPVIASTVIVNLVLPAGNSRKAGIEAAVRLTALTMPLALLFAAVPARSLLDALEIRGLPAGFSYVVAAALAAVPAARRRVERLRQGRIARGLDRGRGIGARSRTVLELTGATVGGMLAEVEDRTLALEVRGFRGAGRRTQLDPAPDRAGERVLRWTLLAAALTLVAARVGGRL